MQMPGMSWFSGMFGGGAAAPAKDADKKEDL